MGEIWGDSHQLGLSFIMDYDGKCSTFDRSEVFITPSNIAGYDAPFIRHVTFIPDGVFMPQYLSENVEDISKNASSYHQHIPVNQNSFTPSFLGYIMIN